MKHEQKQNLRKLSVIHTEDVRRLKFDTGKANQLIMNTLGGMLRKVTQSFIKATENQDRLARATVCFGKQFKL